RRFERAKDFNDTKKLAVDLLSYHENDVALYGNDVFEKFNCTLSRVNQKLDLSEALYLIDSKRTLAHDLLRAIYINQIRQIELIQYTATEEAKLTMEDYLEEDEFHVKYMENQAKLNDIYKAGRKMLNTAHSDYVTLLAELDDRSNSARKLLANF
ncbi:hypothetical protein L0F63_001686, partial [Massospora cicadina]